MRALRHLINRRMGITLAAAAAAAALLGAQAAADITAAQKEQLKSLATETRRKTELARSELRSARVELHRVYQVYELDERKAKSAIERINSAQLELLRIHLENQLEIRRILDSAQFSQMMRRAADPRGMAPPAFDDVIADRIPDRRMIEDLGLSAEQKRRALASLGPTPERTNVMDRLRRDTRRMMELYSRYDLDIAAANRLIDSIHAAQVELSAVSYKQQQSAREVLTPRQFERLQKAMAERMQSSKKPHPRR